MSASDQEPDQKRAFDWDSMQERIAAVSAALVEMKDADPEMAERVWAQRAAQLAKPPERAEEGAQIELALIQLGREVYGIDVQYILEIRPATRVPRAPEWVTGVVNLRGRILSVLDLRLFFGLAPAEAREEEDRVTPFPDLVVVETPTMEVALLAEDVLEVEPFPTSQIQNVGETIRGISSEYVRGVIERGAEVPMIVVLNLPALLADERLIIEEEVA
jgi:purine-binding chemotaxis protein CheW